MSICMVQHMILALRVHKGVQQEQSSTLISPIVNSCKLEYHK